MATINLSKGQTINLSKTAKSENFYLELGWNEAPGQDLDASAFLCRHNADGDAVLIDPSPQFLISYATGFPTDNGVIHSGDNLTGKDIDGQEGDEVIRFYPAKFDPRIEQIAIIITIHDAFNRRQDFSKVSGAYLRIRNMDSAGNPLDEIARYDLTGNGAGFISLHFGSLMKNASGDWEFQALGQGLGADLGQIIQLYSPSTNVTY